MLALVLVLFLEFCEALEHVLGGQPPVHVLGLELFVEVAQGQVLVVLGQGSEFLLLVIPGLVLHKTDGLEVLLVGGELGEDAGDVHRRVLDHVVERDDLLEHLVLLLGVYFGGVAEQSVQVLFLEGA